VHSFLSVCRLLPDRTQPENVLCIEPTKETNCRLKQASYFDGIFGLNLCAKSLELMASNFVGLHKLASFYFTYPNRAFYPILIKPSLIKHLIRLFNPINFSSAVLTHTNFKHWNNDNFVTIRFGHAPLLPECNRQ